MTGKQNNFPSREDIKITKSVFLLKLRISPISPCREVRNFVISPISYFGKHVKWEISPFRYFMETLVGVGTKALNVNIKH